IVGGKEFHELPALAVLVAASPPGCLGDRDLGLLLEPIAFESPIGPPLVGGGDRPHGAEYRAAERKEQPPELCGESKRAHLARMPPRRRGFDPELFAQSRKPVSAGFAGLLRRLLCSLHRRPSVAFGLEPLDRALHLGLGFLAADP